MITFTHKGNFSNTERFLKKSQRMQVREILNRYGRQGVDALSMATPIDTGLTSNSWKYEVIITNRGYSIRWLNTNIINGVPIAIILQYGHGTKNGGYVQGVDYINPALKPIFASISDSLWKEVTNI
jgi:hypothetical protein